MVYSRVFYSRVNYSPSGRVLCRMRTDLGTAEGIESREPVHFVTQQTRFALINNILQHPEQLPSMYELEEQPQRERGHRLQAHSEAH